MICNVPAHYVVNGVPMCRRHAGFAVLDSLIKGARPTVGRIAAAVLLSALIWLAPNAAICCPHNEVEKWKANDEKANASATRRLSRNRMTAPLVQHWAVEVRVNGEAILTIESNNNLCGVANIDDYADVVRTCARHLSSFIGPDRQSPHGAPRDRAMTAQNQPSEAALKLAREATEEWLADKSEEGHSITKLVNCIAHALDAQDSGNR